jgi:hypothetical protein
LDVALHHWFEGEGSDYSGITRLTEQQSKAVLEDNAKIQRIFAPIDVLADNVWSQDGQDDRWIKVFTQRACTYVCNAAPYVKSGEKVPSLVIENWYILAVSEFSFKS